MRVLIVLPNELRPYGMRLLETIEPYCEPKLCAPEAFEIATSVGRGDTQNIFMGPSRYMNFLGKVADWQYKDYLVRWGTASKNVLLRVDDADGWFSLSTLVDSLEENIAEIAGGSRFARTGDWKGDKLPPGVWLADRFLSKAVLRTTGRMTDESRVIDLQWRWVVSHFLRHGFAKFHGGTVIQTV